MRRRSDTRHRLILRYLHHATMLNQTLLGRQPMYFKIHFTSLFVVLVCFRGVKKMPRKNKRLVHRSQTGKIPVGNCTAPVKQVLNIYLGRNLGACASPVQNCTLPVQTNTLVKLFSICDELESCLSVPPIECKSSYVEEFFNLDS